MRLFPILLAMIAAALPASALAQTAQAPQSAETPRPLLQTDWARTKYQWAIIAENYGRKCQKLSDFHNWAVIEARTFYGGQIDEAGLKADRQAFSDSIDKVFVLNSCAKLQQEQMVIDAVNNVAHLGNEYLLAIHFADITSCGVMTEARMAKLVAHLPELYTAAQSRPDLGLFVPLAKERGAQLNKACNSIIAQDPMLLGTHSLGKMLIKAAELFDPPARP